MLIRVIKMIYLDMSLVTVGGLDKMIFEGPFQHNPFCDFVKSSDVHLLLRNFQWENLRKGQTFRLPFLQLLVNVSLLIHIIGIPFNDLMVGLNNLKGLF